MFFIVVLPLWLTLRRVSLWGGSMLYPAVSNVGHPHMWARLATHLKENDCEKADDKFGRLPATFYMNWVRQQNSGPRRPATANQMDKH